MPEEDFDVVIDTDLLSSFLKIGRANLIKDFFNVNCVSIPLAVFTEIGMTDLVNSLIETDWIRIRTMNNRNSANPNSKDLDTLGVGEQEWFLCVQNSPNLSLYCISDLRERSGYWKCFGHVQMFEPFLEI